MSAKPLTGPELKELTDGLSRLARNLWWCWDQEAQDIFQQLSPRGWQNLDHNPVAVLHEVSDYELRMRLHPVSVVTGGPMIFPLDATSRLARLFRLL